jgi:hypothetical protein
MFKPSSRAKHLMEKRTALGSVVHERAELSGSA